MVSSSSVLLRTVAVDVVDQDEDFRHAWDSLRWPTCSDELLGGEELGQLGAALALVRDDLAGVRGGPLR